VGLNERRYDAGSSSSRTQNWRTPSSDANGAIDRPATIRNRARDLARNNPWARKGIDVVVNNTIGYGVLAQWSGRNATTTKRLQQLWDVWADTTDCDATGISNFYGLQQLAMRAMVESGECLIRMRLRQSTDGLSVPMQLQVMEADHLVTSLDGKNGGNRISNGIEYDQLGRRVAYYLYHNHPGATSISTIGDYGKYSRVAANEVVHLYRRDRPNQEIGVSWLAPAIITLRELDIYEDAYLKRQQIANLHAAFVHTEDDIDTEAEQYTDLAEGLVPGSIYLMRPNRSVEFNSPPPAGDYGPYTMENLRRVAAALGITFESLTGNLSEVNFSSARMGWQEMGRNVDAWRWNLFIPTFCGTVSKWFANTTTIDTTAAAEWTPPARMMVDPAREMPPIKEAIRSGLMTLSDAIRGQGYEPTRHLQQMAVDAALIDSLGLVLDSDPRNDAARLPSTETTDATE